MVTAFSSQFAGKSFLAYVSSVFVFQLFHDRKAWRSRGPRYDGATQRSQ